MSWKCVLCFFLSMMFLIQAPATAEVARSQEYYLPHTGDCVYAVTSIQSGGHVALDEVKIAVFYPNGTLSFVKSLSTFNTSGDPYYRNVKFHDDSDLGNLSVGDAFFFNKTVYWGGHFYLSNLDGTKQFTSATIVDTDGSINLIIDIATDGPISSFPFDALGLVIILIIALSVVFLIIVRMTVVRIRKKP